MLRKLLALLVVITGLTAVGQPAHAVALKVDSVQAAAAGYVCTAQPSERSTSSIRREREEVQPKQCPKPPRIVLIVPTVMLHADRARE